MTSDDSSSISIAASIGNHLGIYLNQDQGVRLGESTVISRKAHARMPEMKIKGKIKILVNLDAGQHYLKYIDKDQVVHMDVYHRQGIIDPCTVAHYIYRAIMIRTLEEEPRLEYAEDELNRIVNELARKIIISTSKGSGVLIDLLIDKVEPLDEGEEGRDHVHILARLKREEYDLIFLIADCTETALLDAGIELAMVKEISHGKQKEQKADFAHSIKIPWKTTGRSGLMTLPEKENVNQLVLALAEQFGGIKEIDEFMDCYSTNILKRRGLEDQKKRWGDVEHFVDQLEELGLIKSSILGKHLSRPGAKLKEYMMEHQLELETEIRRKIRKEPGGKTSFKKMEQAESQNSLINFTNRNKTINDWQARHSGNLAVPETIKQAKINGFRRGDQRFRLRRQDLHYHDIRTYMPVDICLLMDASGSMAGEKRQAACYLSEHLLLSGKERIAVVTFQERESRVAVPFTRNEIDLRRGLASIKPQGLTPLATGIVTACDLIKHTKNIKNPLMVLITDGIPNVALWTMDAVKDAMMAADIIQENRIRFICIGVEANKSFLQKLCDAAHGGLYLVDDLNKDNLIRIVRAEKRSMSLEMHS